jgi:hypothetical protein
MRTWHHRRKKYPQIAGVSMHWFNTTAVENAQVFSENTYLFAVSKLVCSLQNYSQQNKQWVSFTGGKHCRVRQVMHYCKNDNDCCTHLWNWCSWKLAAGGDNGIGVFVFCVLQDVCVVLVRGGCSMTLSKYFRSLLLVSTGLSTVKSKSSKNPTYWWRNSVVSQKSVANKTVRI